MFCLSCGAEIASYLTACPNCGRPIVSGASANEATSAGAAPSRPLATPPASGFAVPVPALSSRPLAVPLAPPAQPAVAPPMGSAAPSIGEGDLGGTLLPRDTLGRVILATSAAMAADVLAPWVVVGGQHIPLAHIGAPVLVLLAALVVPILAVRPTLRKQPLWAAAPLVLGSMFLGGGLGVLVLLAWLAPRVQLIGTNGFVGDTSPVQSGGIAPMSFPPAYTADVGVYLFLVGAVLLMVAGYQLLMAAREGQRQILPAAAGMMGGAVAGPGALALAASAPMAAAGAPAPASVNAPAPSAAVDGGAGSSPRSTPSAAPPPASPQAGPVLPGTAAWNQPRDAPAATRSPSVGGGSPRPLGPRPSR